MQESNAPFDQRDGWIWLNGDFVPWREAKIHIGSHGLHYASSVFEGIRIYHGKIFKGLEHMERLIASAKMLDMTIPYGADYLRAVAEMTCQKNELKNGYIRPLVWRGAETLGVAGRHALPKIAIFCWSWGSYFGDKQEKGITLVTSPWKKPPPECVPSQAKAAGLYTTNTLNKHYAESKNYDDSLVLDWRGQVAESSAANIFSVKNNILATPVADCFLDGITRQTVIDLATKAGMKVEEKAMFPQDFLSADEIFVTGTAAEVTPVRLIDDQKYTVGPITKTLQKAYKAMTLA